MRLVTTLFDVTVKQVQSQVAVYKRKRFNWPIWYLPTLRWYLYFIHQLPAVMFNSVLELQKLNHCNC